MFHFSFTDYAALDKELDQLNSAMDKVENWSTTLHDKVAEFLKETQQQNSNSSATTAAAGSTEEPASSGSGQDKPSGTESKDSKENDSGTDKPTNSKT